MVGREANLNGLISVLAGLTGVCVGAYLSWIATKRQRQITVAFDLHRELYSNQMIDHRYAGGLLLAEHRSKTYLEIRNQIGEVAMKDVWLVCAFYQRLWLAIYYKGIKKEYVPELFGDLFYWWYDSSFRTQLVPLEIESAFYIRKLHDWMEKNSSESQKQRWHAGNLLMSLDSAKGDSTSMGGQSGDAPSQSSVTSSV